MAKKRKFSVEPGLLQANGAVTREIVLNIGDNPPGATGVMGATGPVGATGATAPLELTAPDGGVWEITVDNSGNLITTLVG